jgi:hypothetical protein
MRFRDMIGLQLDESDGTDIPVQGKGDAGTVRLRFSKDSGERASPPVE